MVNLKFEINDSYLITFMIARAYDDGYIDYAKDKYQKDIINFQNRAWAESEELYDILRGRFYLAIPTSNTQNYKDLGTKLDSYIKQLSKLEEYKKLKKQTLESSKLIEKEWKSNYMKTEKYLNDLGIKISEEFTIRLIHPGLKVGRYNGNNSLSWSHQTYWPNYNTVYLWHEMLHSYFKFTEYEHTLIELITDDHMRYILNGTEYPPFEGHDYLMDFKKEVLPIWQKYLKSENKDIKNLVEEFKVAYEKFGVKK